MVNGVVGDGERVELVDSAGDAGESTGSEIDCMSGDRVICG